MAGLNKNSLENAAARLLNPQTEEQEVVDEAKNPVEEDNSEEVEIEQEVDQEVVEDTEEETTEEDEEVYVEDVNVEEREEEPDTETQYTVKVNGEELEVNLEELTSGYQRNKDYTNKTQALAEKGKAVETTIAQLESERALYIEKNKQMLGQKQTELAKFETIDWATLSVEDPLEYAQKQAQYSETKRQAQIQVDDTRRAMQEQEQLNNQRLQVTLQEQHAELLKVLPEASKKEFKEELGSYALSLGYTNEDLGGLVNAIDIVTLHKAKLYDDIQKGKVSIKQKKGVPKAKRRVKASGAQVKSIKKARSVKEKRNTLRKSGSLRDAAALLRG